MNGLYYPTLILITRDRSPLFSARTSTSRRGSARSGRSACRARRRTRTLASQRPRPSAPSSTPAGRTPRACPSTPCCSAAGARKVGVSVVVAKTASLVFVAARFFAPSQNLRLFEFFTFNFFFEFFYFQFFC